MVPAMIGQSLKIRITAEIKSMIKQPSEIQKAGFAFCDALRNAALEACDTRDPHAVMYYMKRSYEIEGTLRTINRMQGND